MITPVQHHFITLAPSSAIKSLPKLRRGRVPILARRYFQISVPIEIAQRLGALIKAHPEFGYRSVGEAGKHALVRLTRELEALVASGGSTETRDENVHEIVDLLQRYLAEKRKEQEKKKPR